MNSFKPLNALVWIALCFNAAVATAQQGLLGEYYNGTNFDQKVLTRVDSRIHFSWFDQSPAPGVRQSEYSIRWTGQLTPPKSGTYKFSAKVDDGIRLWVGNRKIIDAWQPNDWGEFEGNIDLTANQSYPLKVEFYNGIREGEIQLYWVVPGEGGVISSFLGRGAKPIEAQYFSQPKPLAAKPATPVQSLPNIKPAPVQQPVRKKPKPSDAKPKEQSVTNQVPRKSSPETSPPPVERPSEEAVQSTPAPIKKPSEETLQRRQKELELKPIYFVRSTDELLPESKVILDNWAEFLHLKTTAIIEIRGHTDDLGNAQKNQELSEKRAQLVANYLAAHKVPEASLRTKGYGGTQPIYVNPAGERERAFNRRVEIRVVKN